MKMKPLLFGVSLLSLAVLAALAIRPPVAVQPTAARRPAGAAARALINQPRTSDSAEAVLIQPDGKIVVAGGASTGDGAAPRADFALARYLPDGTLDAAFGRAGRTTLDFGGRLDRASALARQADGKLVAAGESCLRTPDTDWISGVTFDCNFALARLNPDGSPDAAFGEAGRVLTDFGAGRLDDGIAVAVQRDGQLIVAGVTRPGEPSIGPDFALARYRPDGTLDPTFGAAGRVVTDFGGYDSAVDVAVLIDGRILAAGSSCCAEASSGFDLALYLPDGSLDPGFGAGGRVRTEFTDLAYPDLVGGLAVQSGGRIVLAGCLALSLGGQAELARYTARGELDPGFGAGGKMMISLGGEMQCVSDVAALADGRIVVAGYSAAIHGGCHCDFIVARLTETGALDPTFGSAGVVTTSFSELGSEGAAALAVQADGRLVVAGYAGPYGGDSDFAVARYLPEGAPDPAFGVEGRVQTDFANRLAANGQPIAQLFLPLVGH
jgi:uncharacterized delta-60 repeat protein